MSSHDNIEPDTQPLNEHSEAPAAQSSDSVNDSAPEIDVWEELF